MTANSPALLYTCAALRAKDVPLRASLAGVRVAALCPQTGRQRRVLTTEAVASITPDELASYLSRPLNDVAQRPWYFDPSEGFLNFWPLEGWPQIEVCLVPQHQRRGVRWLFACPACKRLTRRVYGVPTCEGDEVGCQTCLGLVYPSQTRHRTRQGDAAVLSGHCPATWARMTQAHAREERRLQKQYGRWAASLGHSLEFFADNEAVRALYGENEISPLPWPNISEIDRPSLSEQGPALLED